MSKHILILGSGLVSPPVIHYLSDYGYRVTIASRTKSKADVIIAGLKNKDLVNSVEWDVEQKNAFEALDTLTQQTDLVISLLPYLFHVQAAKIALKYKKHFCTTSYVSDAMAGLDAEAKAAGVVLLNECGVDPGLDHMSAKKVIDEVHAKGGKIISFYSLCGGLPAPDANTNPFGYKLSWSPRGVLLASRNQATFLVNGERVVVPGKDLYTEQVYRTEQVGDLGKLEWYPNRDSTTYTSIYDIPEVRTIIRGTYRNVGWCRTMRYISEYGFTSTDESDTWGGITLAKFTAKVLGGNDDKDIKQFTADKLKLAVTDEIIAKFEWIGLFSTELTVPTKIKTPLDVLCFLFERSLVYADGEKDMIAMQHTFEIEYSATHRETLTSTLIDFGQQPTGFSSMARTVSLPVGVVARAVLDGRLKHTGLLRPVTPDVYNLVLAEMETLGVKFVEKKLAPQFWLRDEVKPGEERVAVVPSDAKKLLDAGFRVSVERSQTRCIRDEEYAAVGAELVPTGSWMKAPAPAIILGLKELPDNDDPLQHRHIYFAHCYKQQGGWEKVLSKFVRGKGLLYDLEFLVDDNGRRVAAFGRPAGVVGMAVGLLQWAAQQLGEKQLQPLKSWNSTQALVDTVKGRLEQAAAKTGRHPTALVIGALGRCGGGSVWFAQQCGVKPIEWDLAETKSGGPFPQLLQVDVLVNAIYLSTKIPPFITNEQIASTSNRQLSVFVDVSCDTSNPNNPFPIYNTTTTLTNPVLHIGQDEKQPLDVIAIDHLPSLVPNDSSAAFSADILPSLLKFDAPQDPLYRVWQRAETLFHEKVKTLPQ